MTYMHGAGSWSDLESDGDWHKPWWSEGLHCLHIPWHSSNHQTHIISFFPLCLDFLLELGEFFPFFWQNWNKWKYRDAETIASVWVCWWYSDVWLTGCLWWETVSGDCDQASRLEYGDRYHHSHIPCITPSTTHDIWSHSQNRKHQHKRFLIFLDFKVCHWVAFSLEDL